MESRKTRKRCKNVLNEKEVCKGGVSIMFFFRYALNSTSFRRYSNKSKFSVRFVKKIKLLYG